MTAVKSKKTFFVFLKEFFWDSDNIGEEQPVVGETPEQTRLLQETQADADKRYEELSNNSKVKEGQESIVKQVKTDQNKALENARKVADLKAKQQIKEQERTI